MLSKVGLYGLTAVSAALTDSIVLVGTSRVLTPIDASCPSSPYNGPCFPRMPYILPSGSSVAFRS